MSKVYCDLCTKEIKTKNWVTIAFPRVVADNQILEYYKESDVCHSCIIGLTKHTKIQVIERQPVEIVAPNVEESKDES